MVFIPKLSIALDMYNLGQCEGILDKKDTISSGPHPHNNREQNLGMLGFCLLILLYTYTNNG